MSGSPRKSFRFFRGTLLLPPRAGIRAIGFSGEGSMEEELTFSPIGKFIVYLRFEVPGGAIPRVLQRRSLGPPETTRDESGG